MKMDMGPRTRDQMKRLGQVWEQGQHIVISGSTGSGKTMLARHIDQVWINHGGFVMVMVGKRGKDATIADNYKGFTRWTDFKKRPTRNENRVLLWPDTDKYKAIGDKKALQKDVFRRAFEGLEQVGKWNLHVDEGLYMCVPRGGLNMEEELASAHMIGRSNGLSITTLTQRPAHIPLIVYSSASHAFVGRTRELADNKRLAELSGRNSAKELAGIINEQGRHDFLWVPVATDEEPEPVNLTK